MFPGQRTFTGSAYSWYVPGAFHRIKMIKSENREACDGRQNSFWVAEVILANWPVA